MFWQLYFLFSSLLPNAHPPYSDSLSILRQRFLLSPHRRVDFWHQAPAERITIYSRDVLSKRGKNPQAVPSEELHLWSPEEGYITFYLHSIPLESQSLYPSRSWALGWIQNIFQKQIASWGVIVCHLLLPRGIENEWADDLEWKAGKCLVKWAALQFAANEAAIFSADGLGNVGMWYVLTPSGEVSISSRMQPFPQSARYRD